MSGEWKHGLCGCFDNCGICLLSFVVPCYQFGKTAEAVGESCCVCGILYFVPIANIIAMFKVRGMVREKSAIEASAMSDLCMILCCGFCALVQEAQEVKDMSEQGMSMSRE